MRKNEILLEVALNQLLGKQTEKASDKRLIPRRQGIRPIRKSDLKDSGKKDNFFGGLFKSAWNIKDRVVCVAVINADKDILGPSLKKCEILLCKPKGQKYLIIPRLVISKSVSYDSEADMVDGIIDYSMSMFPYFYDVDFKSCCKNDLLFSPDMKFILVPTTQGEWSGTPVKPRKPVYPDLNELVWVDLIKVMDDEEYAKQFLFGDFTLQALGWILSLIY